MEFVLVLSICPKCQSWQSGQSCGDCGGETFSPDTCSNCRTSCTTKFCGSCGAPTCETLVEKKSNSNEQPEYTFTIPAASTPVNNPQSVPNTFVSSSQPVQQRSSVLSQSQPATYRSAINMNTQPNPVVAAPVRNPPRPNYSQTDTSSIIGAGVRPSAVLQGRTGSTDDDPLAKYRVAATDNTESVDWNKTLRSASRAFEESDPARYQSSPYTNVSTPAPAPTPAPVQAVRPSEGLRRTSSSSTTARPAVKVPPPSTTTHYAPNPTPSYNPAPSYQPAPSYNQNVLPTPTLRPSILREQSDPLEKYRVKSTDTSAAANPPPSTTAPATYSASSYVHNPPVPTPTPSNNQNVLPIPTLRPSILRDQGDDPLSKYRVKSPEEEQRTWEFYFQNIPAAPGKEIVFTVDDRQLYSGIGNGGIVNTRVTHCLNNLTSATALVLKIGLINFNLNKTLDISKGRFVRFAVEQGQMKFRQQKSAFDD